jgi:hypothetical protein
MTTATKTTPKIEYAIAPIREIKIVDRTPKGKVTMIEIEGRKMQPTGRFWTSLCSTFSTHGLSTKIFKLFQHDEVLKRLTDKLGGDKNASVRYAYENYDPTPGRLLAVTLPTKAIVPIDRIGDTLGRYNALSVEYGDGIMRSTHTPNHMADFKIGPDVMTHQYCMETPIDGFGSPLIYLSLLRQVCSNGMVGYARAFRSEISIGRGNNADADVMFSVERALDSFSNEEGYQALRQRYESATQSWASIMECNRILKVFTAMAQKNMFIDTPAPNAKIINSLAKKRTAVIGGDGAAELEGNPTAIKILRAYSQLTGDLCSIYGLTHLDALSRKKMQQLPARCSMYELMNLTTEVATHFCDARNGRLLHAEMGNMVSCEYDLEGTKVPGGKEVFQDWFLKA